MEDDWYRCVLFFSRRLFLYGQGIRHGRFIRSVRETRQHSQARIAYHSRVRDRYRCILACCREKKFVKSAGILGDSDHTSYPDVLHAGRRNFFCSRESRDKGDRLGSNFLSVLQEACLEALLRLYGRTQRTLRGLS